ncbi:hypothetical protein FA95DRAFT_1511808 [Auriscalpium vulgare]|uniref:Uncharacterized protein n=1 Tax=Auriscalpium vulgare TaxID=40419 RepID=A0ACB8S666_9AGAM|nr:hypothetical protein FA95DRAFT_1511808 [Auriscalpium vulgare]
MGFCRRCGDIVTGVRCHCGGTAVAGVVQWNKGETKGPNTDRWSQTYVARDSTPAQPGGRALPSSGPLEGRRFPRPASTIGSRVSAHIASTTTSRPPSPLKNSAWSSSTMSPSIPADIIPSPHTSELSKVYGSVLQSSESLATFHCHVCSTTFPPDATIYPDPADASGTRFMCRSCFADNGGSRGACHACSRPVLILKSEGGFVENAGRVWHKKCFNCAGCGQNVGDKPMVDLLGQPSCVDCFETHLNKSASPRRHASPAVTPKKTEPTTGNIGGFRANRRQSREGSPALDELEQKLGIRSREATPVKVEESNQARPSTHVSARPSASSPLASRLPDRPQESESSPLRRIQVTDDGSPVRRTVRRYQSSESLARSTTSSPHHSSPKPSTEAVEQMKKRLFRETGSPAPDPAPHPAPESVLAQSSPKETTPRSTPRGGHLASMDTNTPTPPARSLAAGGVRASGLPRLRRHDSNSSLRTDTDSVLSMSSSIPSTPSLMSDFSDVTTQSSASSSPPSYSPPTRHHSDVDVFSLSGRSNMPDPYDATRHPLRDYGDSHKQKPPHLSLGPSPDAKCAKCDLALFNIRAGGRYVTIPEPSTSGAPPKVYHADCFRCGICNGAFEEKESGQVIFVRGVRGGCHLNCAPPEKYTTIRHITSAAYPPTSRTHTPPKSMTSTKLSGSPSSPYSSSRYTAPLQTAPPTTKTFPRFGGSASCPGCNISVSPMERGVVPGPQGTKWHSSCLMCGGKTAKGRNGRRKDGQPGCGKTLDSSSKRDAEEGKVWCKECLLLLPPAARSSPRPQPQPSPTRTSPLKPTHTGASSGSAGPFSRIAPQYTGTTTIVRQFTGLSGGVDAALSRELTGGGLSPTRQLTSSPTKQLGRQFTGGTSAVGGTIRPRPKSVIGMRDEGRGMFLVRQMTGGGAA